MSVEKLLSDYRADATRLSNESRAHERMMRKAEAQHALVEAKITGILEALEALKSEINGPTDKTAERAEQASAAPKIRKRHRKLSPEWQQIMQYADNPNGFGYDVLAESAQAVGHVVAKDNLRSQMSLYKAAGLVDAIGPGVFRLTDAGRAAAGIEPTNSEASASNETGAAEAAPRAGPDANPAFHQPQTPIDEERQVQA